MNEYNNIFLKLFGRSFEIVSTVDHPYTSPPMHLFDAHLNLMERYSSKVLVLNWDVSLPGKRTYRYDLITDTGLIAKKQDLYHYVLNTPYCFQDFNSYPWKLLPQDIEIAIKFMKEKYNLNQLVHSQIKNRAFRILDLAQKSYQAKPWLYTRDLLANFYLFFDKPKLSDFIIKHYSNYWLSPFTTYWIPWCMKNIKGKLSFRALLSSGVFLRKPFRVVRDLNNHNNLDDLQMVAEGISRGNIIPSLDVFLWSLVIAEIKHHGNDFGFFQRLAGFTGIGNIVNFQVTKPGEDALRFMRLKNDFAVLLSGLNYQCSKTTRINSFSSLYVIGGDSVVDYLQKYSRSTENTEKIIDLF